jgi:ABC-type antimicrobial peptide transport system permease subunit
MLLADYIETAAHSLRMNRMRTLLTTVGVAIGIASVTTILALAQGVTNAVNDQVNQVGGNVAVIRPGVQTPSDLTRPILPQQFNTSSLTDGDVDAIESTNKDLIVAPVMTITGTLRTKTTSVPATLVASTPELAKTTELPLDQGQFLDDATSDNVAIIGQQLAIDLFGTENPIGAQFRLHDQTMTVIGVLKKLDNPVNYNNVDFDNAAIITFDRGKTFHQGRSQIQQINIQATSTAKLQSAIKQVNAELLERHGEQDFQIMTGNDVASTTNRTFQWVAAVMTAIAAISLLVGGIGIMNIMLVGVAERTREIGIRKSVGASNGTIVTQFLVEALMLSLLGGILGAVAGVVLAFSIALGLYFTPVFTWQIFAAAFGVSVGVGGLFGLYPAIRAARKDPIESLRQYR